MGEGKVFKRHASGFEHMLLRYRQGKSGLTIRHINAARQLIIDCENVVRKSVSIMNWTLIEEGFIDEGTGFGRIDFLEHKGVRRIHELQNHIGRRKLALLIAVCVDGFTFSKIQRQFCIPRKRVPTDVINALDVLATLYEQKMQGGLSSGEPYCAD